MLILVSESPSLFFHATAVEGAFVIEPSRVEDERGFLARTFCRDAFAERGLETVFVQCTVSHSLSKGTLRGMHFQASPHEEVKLVRCTRGAVHDVVLDLRPGSPTFKSWIAVVLSEENRHLIYVPKGCAHGFQALTPQAEVFYQMSTPFEPSAACGVRWDDPAFGIQWPEGDRVISPRDREYPDFCG